MENEASMSTPNALRELALSFPEQCIFFSTSISLGQSLKDLVTVDRFKQLKMDPREGFTNFMLPSYPNRKDLTFDDVKLLLVPHKGFEKSRFIVLQFPNEGMKLMYG